MKHGSVKTLGVAALGAAFVAGTAGSAAAVTDDVTSAAGGVAGGVTSALHDVATDEEMHKQLSGAAQHEAADQTLSAPSTGVGSTADPVGQAASQLLGGLPTGDIGLV